MSGPKCEACGRFARITKWHDPALGRTLDTMGGPESYPICDDCDNIAFIGAFIHAHALAATPDTKGSES